MTVSIIVLSGGGFKKEVRKWGKPGGKIAAGLLPEEDALLKWF